MINWKLLNSSLELQNLVRESHQHTILILKHSTRCSISSIAKMRLEDQWDHAIFSDTSCYLLDVIADRAISEEVSRLFDVYHESPQILVITAGECIHDASHFDINMEELRDVSPRPNI